MSKGPPVDLYNALKPAVLTLRIITVAMLVGVSTFIGIAVFLRVSGQQGAAGGGTEIMAPASIVCAVIALFASWLFPMLLVGPGRKAIANNAANTAAPPALLAELGDVGKLYALYQTTAIMGLAMLEGAAFFGGLAYLLEGNSIALVAVAVLIGAMLLRFPSTSRIVDWIENQYRLMEEERVLSR